MSSTLLEYEASLFKEMFQNEAALLIMAEGLGIERIFLNFLKLYSDSSQLVLVLNTHEAEEEFFIEKLKEENGPLSVYGKEILGDEIPTTSSSSSSDDKISIQLPTRITNETHTVAERVETYLKGGCFFVTSRILVVDMLTDRVPFDLVSGILVYNAHRVIDSCQETFILRMFRQKNKKGFIKAFSDNPVFFTRGFSKVEKVMKNLFCTKLLIYPRFHVDVDSELSRHKCDLVEVMIGLNENTARIQMALIDIINVLLQEFKACCSYIDHDFLTMEMVISRPFDQQVKAQLDPVWNQLGSKPKQLLSDINSLRLLIYYLTQYDCITFYKMLNCVRSYDKEMGRSSGWIFLDAANELFSRARLRVYGNETKNYSKTDLNNRFFYTKENKDLVRRVIEESPKLKTLKEVIEELETEDNLTNEINILIVAKDDRTCSQIKHFLKSNRLTRSIRSKDEKSSSDNKGEKELDKIVVLDDRQEEKDDEFMVKMIIQPMTESQDGEEQRGGVKRRHNTLTQLAKKTSKDKNAKTTSNSDEAAADEEIVELNDSISSQELNTDSTAAKSSSSSSTRRNKLVYLCALEDGTKQKISILKLMYQLKPKYVILYDAVLWFVRQIEVYKTLNYNLDLRVYLLMYKNSCEEQRYLTSVRCEKESFEILIREKATMIIPTEQDGKQQIEQSERLPISVQAMNLPPRRDTNVDETTPIIIVDIREFRSELPSILHKKGFRIEPVTLEVGDYVLTPNIAVERKSINDLIESLSNGRLYNQVNAMSRSYKYPILLIEFDQNKPFQLNSYQSLVSNEISPNHVSSKLVLLTIHFPRLRILWCSSCAETADIFDELKSGCQQPNAEAAMAIKTDLIADDNDDIKYNPVLKDILLKIPGINSKNVYSLMSKVENLLELLSMSEDEINKIIENTKNAKTIYEFINKTIKYDASDKNEFGFEDLNDFFIDDNNTEQMKSTSNANASKDSATSKDLLKINANKKTRTKKTKK